MIINIRRLSPNVPLPEYKTAGACAFDIAVLEGATLQPNERTMFNTGLVVNVPNDHVLLLAPRSSNAKKGIRLSNGIGIIDSDYCGPNDEIKLSLHNIGTEPYTVESGERIAQGMFVPITRATFAEPQEWGLQDRGGFGTTG
ncbi:MAG: dUTP diphosphatase [Patescibacteria group bacterium]